MEDRQKVERKIRILKSYIEADRRKKDSKQLEVHKKALQEQEKYLQEMGG
ncbi:hypothetical protein [Sporanaerobium hydrogeniformans]|nr:hypothetical protein [Sporanaerobium hydrogeniformans]